MLRQYLAAFGIESPPRESGEEEKARATLVHCLIQIAKERPRATVAHVWAPPPPEDARTQRALLELRHRRIELRWTLPPFEAGVGSGDERRGRLGDVVDEAVRVHARTTRARAAAQLKRLGIRLVARPIVRKAPIAVPSEGAVAGTPATRQPGEGASESGA